MVEEVLELLHCHLHLLGGARHLGLLVSQPQERIAVARVHGVGEEPVHLVGKVVLVHSESVRSGCVGVCVCLVYEWRIVGSCIRTYVTHMHMHAKVALVSHADACMHAFVRFRAALKRCMQARGKSEVKEK